MSGADELLRWEAANDLDLASERETVREPAKAWRNKFSCAQPIFTQRNGAVGPGEFWGSGVYRTREDAEAQARDDMVEQIIYVIERGVSHLGAFPVDENGEPL